VVVAALRAQSYLERNLAADFADLAVPVDSARTSNLRAALNRLDDAVPVEMALPVAERLARSERWIVHSWVNATTPETLLSVLGEIARCLENDQMT
jgi:hypothetical protein